MASKIRLQCLSSGLMVWCASKTSLKKPGSPLMLEVQFRIDLPLGNFKNVLDEYYIN